MSRLTDPTDWQLEEFTVKELKAYAKRLGLTVDPEDLKDDLVQMIWTCERTLIRMELAVKE